MRLGSNLVRHFLQVGIRLHVYMMPPLHWLWGWCTEFLCITLLRSVLILYIPLELLDYIRCCCLRGNEDEIAVWLSSEIGSEIGAQDYWEQAK